METSPCYYCGQPAGTIDHVVPQILIETAIISGDLDSYLGMTGRGRKLIVPACQQCNSILGADYDQTLADRKARLKARLRVKLKADLNMPAWTDAEIEELSPRLRSYVKQGLIRQQIARQRLAW